LERKWLKQPINEEAKESRVKGQLEMGGFMMGGFLRKRKEARWNGGATMLKLSRITSSRHICGLGLEFGRHPNAELERQAL